MKFKEAVAVFDNKIKDSQIPDRRRPGQMHSVSQQRRDVIISHARNAVARAAGVDRDDLTAIDEVELDPLMATLPAKAYEDARAHGRSSPRNERTNVALFGATVEGREYVTSTRHGFAARRPVARSAFLPAWQPLYDVTFADSRDPDGTPNSRKSYPAQLLAMQNLLLAESGVQSPHDIEDDYHAFVRIAESAGVAYKKRHAMLAALRHARDLLKDHSIPSLYMGAHTTERGLGSLPDLAERLAACGCNRDPRQMRQEELVEILAPTLHAALQRRLAEGRRRNRRAGWFDDQVGMTSRIAASVIRLGYDIERMTYVDLWTRTIEVQAAGAQDGVDPVLAAVMGDNYVHIEDHAMIRVLADESTRRSYLNSPLEVITAGNESNGEVPLYTQRVIQDVKTCFALVNVVFGPALRKHKRETWVRIETEYKTLVEHMEAYNEDVHAINQKRKGDASILWPQAVCLFLPWLMRRVEAAREQLAAFAGRGGRAGSRVHRKHELAFDVALKEYVLAALMLDDGLRVKNYAGALAGKHVVATPRRDAKGRWLGLKEVKTCFRGINDNSAVTLKVAKDELGAERIRQRSLTPGIVRHDYLFEYWMGTRPRDIARRGLLKAVEAFNPDEDNFAFFVSPRRGGRKSAKKPREAYAAMHGCFTEDHLSNIFGRRFHEFVRDVLGHQVPSWDDPKRTTEWRGMFTAHIIRLLVGTYFGGILNDWAAACYLTDDTEDTLRRSYNRVGDRVGALRHVVGIENPNHFDAVIRRALSRQQQDDWSRFWAGFVPEDPEGSLDLLTTPPPQPTRRRRGSRVRLQLPAA